MTLDWVKLIEHCWYNQKNANDHQLVASASLKQWSLVIYYSSENNNRHENPKKYDGDS